MRPQSVFLYAPMSHELTNLLPPERQRRLAREYYLHLATVSVWSLVVIVAFGIAFLAPSFLYVEDEMRARQARIDSMNQNLAGTSGQSANTELASLSASAQYLTRLASTTTASAALRGVLGVPRNGIVLTGITYSLPVATTGHAPSGSMTLTGTAATRESLRAYVAALSALPYVSNANLPISAYAKDANIPFSITLTGSLAPSS